MTESELRASLVKLGASLFNRGYCVGSAGNISVRLSDGYLITPTNSSLGSLQADKISKLDHNWQHIGGDHPSKEVFMHRAVHSARPGIGAVVHLHSTYATAISCLDHQNYDMPIAAMTPYFVMRIGRYLPTVGYYRPGDPAMEQEIHQKASAAPALLLANHGSVVSGKTLPEAVFAAEELEESARLSILLQGLPARRLTESQIEELLATFR